jgi:hypothetical protein
MFWIHLESLEVDISIYIRYIPGIWQPVRYPWCIPCIYIPGIYHGLYLVYLVYTKTYIPSLSSIYPVYHWYILSEPFWYIPVL